MTGELHRRRSIRRADRPPVSVLVGATSFCLYFGLVVYCELVRPEPPGFTCAPGTLIIDAVYRDSPASRAGFLAGDQLLAYNGAAFEGPDAWGTFGANSRFSVAMPVVVERAGVPVSLQLTLARQPLLEFLSARPGAVLAVVRSALLITLLAGLLIVWRRPRDPVALAGAWFLLTCSSFNLALPGRFVTIWRDLPVPISALLWIPHASGLLAGPVLLTFMAVFPRRLPYSGRLLTVVWVTAIAAAAPSLYNFGDLVYRGTTLRPTGHGVMPLFPVTCVMLAGSVVIALLNYRQISDLNERRRLRAVFAGLLAGVLVGFSVVASFLLTKRNLTASLFEHRALIFAAVMLLAAPLSITYAVLRHRLFDISFIVRQWLRYALARWAVLSAAPVMMAVLVADLLGHGHETVNAVLRRHGLIYLTVVLVAVVVYLQRGRWLDAIDRRFFRDRQDGYAILREVAERVRRSATLEEVAPVVVARIEAALHPEFTALLVRDAGGTFRPIAAAPVGYAPPDLDGDAKLVALARVLEKPMDTAADGDGWVERQVPAREIDYLRSARIELLVPVITGHDNLLALLVLGGKRSEEPFAREDHDLLVTIAENLGSVRPSAGAPDTIALFECASCGACYDEGTGACQHDGGRLQPAGLPRTLAGRYRLMERIGSGGMGTVYEALDTALDKRVAVKVARADVPSDINANERLVEEAKLAARLVHPHIVTMLDFGLIDGRRRFLVMERLVGRTLREYLNERRALRPRTALSIIRDVCSAVDAAHYHGLVHRDLKPENIFLVEGDIHPFPKVLDFGMRSR